MLAATALAAHPKPGKRYAGTITNVEKIEGFSAPVSFKVSSAATQLLSFTYGTTGCFGSGGFRTGVNPYTASDLIKVGAITLAHNGRFSISNSKSTYHSTKYGFSYITTSHGDRQVHDQQERHRHDLVLAEVPPEDREGLELHRHAVARLQGDADVS